MPSCLNYKPRATGDDAVYFFLAAFLTGLFLALTGAFFFVAAFFTGAFFAGAFFAAGLEDV